LKIKDIFLTACIIARDSSEFIGRCITSIKNVVDQIVVIDTGSVDDSVRIAKKSGAEVYFYKWNDDFSRVRNEALKYAKGSWIFQIDTDHELIFGKDFELKDYLSRTNKIGFFVSEKSVLSNGDYKILDRLLVFRNIPGLKYEGVIHEHPVKSLREYANKKGITNPFDKIREISLLHYGFLDIDKKMERNIAILKKALNKEPNNWHYRHKLLLSYKSLRQSENYNKLMAETISMLKKNLPNNTITISLMGIIGQVLDYFRENNLYDIQLINYANYVVRISDYADLRIAYPLARIHLNSGNFERAFSILHKYFSSEGTPGYIPISSRDRDEAIRLYIDLAEKVNGNVIKLKINK